MLKLIIGRCAVSLSIRCFLFTCLTVTIGVSDAGRVAFAQTDQEIESARQKAIDYIRKQQTTDGSWGYAGHETGITALCTLALIENGAAIYDPVVDKGYRYVRKNAPARKETYDLALSALLLSRVGDRQDRTIIRTVGARLLAGQTQSGGWSYTCPEVESSLLQDLKRLDRKPGVGDNSNTQFGVLGLWVASRHGVPIEDAMKLVSTRFMQSQGDDGGWSYTHTESNGVITKNPSTHAMTPAGLFCLTVARATKIRAELDKKSTSTKGQKETLLSDPTFSKGLSRVGSFAKEIGPGHARYFIWAIERIGVMLGVEKFEGDVDWFKLGANALIKSQKEDGSWPSDKAENSLADTCFASLFLRKANLGSDISRLLQGQPDKEFVIANRPEVARADSLQDILKVAQAGDVIRVDGNGPFKMNHDDLNRDLTIQAGFGYDPVFEYQVGMSPNGLRYRPEKDKESHHMLKVSAGNVTLEGLRLQMDAPVTSGTIPWKCIYVTGGSLRLLNCSISESNRKGMVPVTIASGGTTVLRNCVLVGGKTSVEIVTNGKQEVTLDNSILFSNACVTISNDSTTKAPADVDLKAYQTIFQGVEAIACPSLAGAVRVESVQSAFKCDSIGLSFLAASNTSKDRSWVGSNNCYNVTNWVGTGGKKNPGVTDIKSFAKFWGDTDKDANKLTLSYTVARKNGVFSHGQNPQDWDITEKSELAIQTKKAGIQPATVGAGDGFSRYREDFNYGLWKKGVSTPALAVSASSSN